MPSIISVVVEIPSLDPYHNDNVHIHMMRLKYAMAKTETAQYLVTKFSTIFTRKLNLIMTGNGTNVHSNIKSGLILSSVSNFLNITIFETTCSLYLPEVVCCTSHFTTI